MLTIKPTLFWGNVIPTIYNNNNNNNALFQTIVHMDNKNK